MCVGVVVRSAVRMCLCHVQRCLPIDIFGRVKVIRAALDRCLVNLLVLCVLPSQIIAQHSFQDRAITSHLFKINRPLILLSAVWVACIPLVSTIRHFAACRC